MLTGRSTETELLDLGPTHYTHEEFVDCQKKLFHINQLLGFFKSTLQLLKKFPQAHSLLDMGCGGGLFILHLSRFFPHMQLRGMDISAEAITLAKLELESWNKMQAAKHVSFTAKRTNDFVLPENTVDILLATLLCHHLNDEELVEFFKHSLYAVRQAVIINDLHRHAIAYWFYALMSPVLFKNRLITHDGLISIRRGFKRKEWERLLKKAAVKNYQIKWQFPFRWQVILWKN